MHRALAGEAFRTESAPFWLLRSGRPEKAYFDFSFSAIRDESGAIVGVLNTAIEVSAHILSERRRAFRLSLEHRLRDVTDPAEAMAVVSEALGRHLSVAQVAYAEVEPGGETGIIERDWHDGTMESNRRRHRLDHYGPELIANLRSGETVTIPDVALDRRTSSPGALATFAQARIVGLLDVPVLKGGQLAAILGVHSHTPHAWLGEEIALAQEVAERTWVAAVEVLFEGEQAIDYRFVEVNPAFQRQTGLREAVGKRMRELAPGHEKHWFEIYGRVAQTGQPTRCRADPRQTGLREHAAHHAVVDVQLTGYGAGRPFLGVVVAQYLRLDVRRRHHGVWAPSGRVQHGSDDAGADVAAPDAAMAGSLDHTNGSVAPAAVARQRRERHHARPPSRPGSADHSPARVNRDASLSSVATGSGPSRRRAAAGPAGSPDTADQLLAGFVAVPAQRSHGCSRSVPGHSNCI